MDDMSYGAHLGGEKSAVQALDFYGVLNDALWIDRLQESYLSEQQQLMVRQTAYKTLLVLADFGIRWGAIAKKGENATTSLHYLERAQTFHDPTRAFYWVRSECQKLLNNKEEAQRDLELFQTTAAATAFDYYLPGHTAGWRGDLEEAKRSYKAALRIQPDHFNSLFFLANRLSADGQKAEAAEVYRACLALRPDHNVTLRNRAILLWIDLPGQRTIHGSPKRSRQGSGNRQT
jgi:tetratricopeptide (TPR) repeat protein